MKRSIKTGILKNFQQRRKNLQSKPFC
jgi:hypothetical protein